MGNKTFKEFQEKPIGKGSMSGDEAYNLSPITSKAVSYSYKSEGMMKKTGTYIDAETDDVMYKVISEASIKLKSSSKITSGEDAFIAFQVSKPSFMGNKLWIYTASPIFEGQTASEEKMAKDDDTALYLVARFVSKDTMTTAECIGEVVVGEDSDDESGFKYEQILKAYKISTMGFNAYVEDMSGECVAKCSPKKKMSVAPKFDIAAGVDPVYVLAAIAACSPGGSSNAGALAGAGVI